MAALQSAIIIHEPKVAKVIHNHPIPKLRDDYILVKTVAVALNPTDWKHVQFLIQEPGPLIGCDYAGIVEAVGSKVTKTLKKGDRICGVAHGSNAIQHEDGTFAEYIVVKGDLQIKIPDNISFEEASTLGIGITTVGQGLYQALGLTLPTAPIKNTEPILIYGGSTATGTLGIQFAKLSGYTVITTCSSRNFGLVKSLGADAVFDYTDPECAKKIRDHTNNKLALAWDTISLKCSAQICADSLTTSSGATYAALLPVKFARSDVRKVSTLAYTAIGEAFTFGDLAIPANAKDFEFGKGFWEISRGLLEAGKLKVHQPRVGRGLQGIVDGLKLLQENKVSGEKLVYLVDRELQTGSVI